MIVIFYQNKVFQSYIPFISRNSITCKLENSHFFIPLKNYFLNVTYFMIRAKLNDHQLSIKKKKKLNIY